jgi:hypothetical protein
MADDTLHNTDGKQKRLQNLTNAGKGRRKGVQNKVTVMAKNVIADVAHRLGGADRMLEWVQTNPENERVFWGTIYPKLLPLQVTGGDEGSNPITMVIRKVVDA